MHKNVKPSFWQKAQTWAATQWHKPLSFWGTRPTKGSQRESAHAARNPEPGSILAYERHTKAKRTSRLSLFLLTTSFFAATAHAYDFVDLATYTNSSTQVVNHACTLYNGTDLSCASTNPYITSAGLVGIGGITPTTALEVNGTVSATQFVGDGSGLTNIPSSAISGLSSDRIISSTDAITVSGTTHTINIYSQGVNTGYFDSTGRLITPGISVTTNQLSATTAYFSGNVGIGTTAPSTSLVLSGAYTTTQLIISATDQPHSFNLDSNNIYFNRTSAPSAIAQNGISGSIIFKLSDMTARDSWLMRLSSKGVGIAAGATSGIATPSATLHVSGTIRIADGGETCDTDRAGAIKYNTGIFYVCNGTNGWQSLSAAASSGGIDRIISNTTGITANGSTGYISVTNAGTTTGYFDSAGRLITPGISVTTNQLSATTAYVVSTTTIGTTSDFGRALIVSGTATLGGTSGAGIGYVNVNKGTATRTAYLDFVLAGGGSSTGYIGYGVSGQFPVWARAGNALVLGASNTEVMRLDTSGYVGITTTAPDSPLHVSGSIHISGNGTEGCTTAADEGKMRRNPSNGRFQVCIP